MSLELMLTLLREQLFAGVDLTYKNWTISEYTLQTRIHEGDLEAWHDLLYRTPSTCLNKEHRSADHDLNHDLSAPGLQ